jgi:glycosyltransferase involved in cell wall biosynthesis
MLPAAVVSPARGPIGLNALFLEPERVGGTEVYTRQLVPELARLAPDREFVLYLSREAAAVAWELPANVRVSAAPTASRSRVQRLGWELAGLVWRARRDGVGLLHSLGTTCPLAAPMPQVVTVHDVIFERWPTAFPRVRTAFLKLLVPRMARGAAAVIADSRATRDEVRDRYGLRDERLHVVHLGPGRPPLPLGEEEAAALRAAAGAGLGYVLSVATTAPHKNLAGLIEACAIARRERPGLRLVLVGAAGTADRTIRAAVEHAGLAGAVVLAGRVDDRTLDALYAGADLFVYPSLCEGFGMPLLEAMQRGVAVLSSDATSLPEVGGEGVAYVDARDPRWIAAAMTALLADDDRRRSLVAAGFRRLERFSWARTAQETLGVYEKVLDERPAAPRSRPARRRWSARGERV